MSLRGFFPKICNLTPIPGTKEYSKLQTQNPMDSFIPVKLKYKCRSLVFINLPEGCPWNIIANFKLLFLNMKRNLNLSNKRQCI